MSPKDKKPPAVKNRPEFPNAYSPAVVVEFVGSSSEDRGFLGRPTVNSDEIIRRFNSGECMKELLMDYYPAEMCDAFIVCYKQKKTPGMIVTLLTEILGSHRLSQRIVGAFQDSFSVNSFEFDRLASPKDLDWGSYVVPAFLNNDDHLLSLLSAMIHVVHAQMILDKSYPPGHEFYDPVAKLANGYTIQQLLLQGVLPAAVMFGLEECYDRYPESFALVLWRSLRLTVNFSLERDKNQEQLIKEVSGFLRDNPSVSIHEKGILLEEFAGYINDSEEYKKLFFEQIVRSCMYVCSFPENKSLQEALTAFQHSLHQPENEERLMDNIAHLLSLGVREEKIESMYINHYLYFSSPNAQEIANEFTFAMNQAGLINPTQYAKKKIDELLVAAKEKAKTSLLHKLEQVKLNQNNEQDSPFSLAIQSVRLGVQNDNIAAITQINEELKVKLQQVFSIKSDIAIAKHLSEMGMVNVDDLHYFMSTLFVDAVNERRRRSTQRNQDFYKDLLFYRYDAENGLSNKILSEGFSPVHFILPSYRGDRYHDALCGFSESFTSRSHAEVHHVNFSLLLSEFPAQLLYHMPVMSRMNGFFSNQKNLIKLKKFILSATTFLTEKKLDEYFADFCLNDMILFLNRYQTASQANRMLSLLESVSNRRGRMSGFLSKEALVSYELLETRIFDGFLHTTNGSFSFDSQDASMSKVTDFLVDLARMMNTLAEHFKQVAVEYASSKDARNYTCFLNELKSRELYHGFYQKIMSFSSENRQKKEWSFIRFILEAIFTPYLRALFQVMNAMPFDAFPTLNWEDDEKVVSYVAGMVDQGQFETNLDYMMGYMSIYDVSNSHVYVLVAEKILLPLLMIEKQENFLLFFQFQALYDRCVVEQTKLLINPQDNISVRMLPLRILVRLIATLDSLGDGLEFLHKECIKNVPFYRDVMLMLESMPKALLVLKLLDYRGVRADIHSVQVNVTKLLASDLGRMLGTLENKDVVAYMDYLCKNEELRNGNGFTVDVMLTELMSVFQNVTIDVVPSNEAFETLRKKLLEVYPVLDELEGLTNHILSVGAHVLFKQENGYTVLIPGHAFVMEEIMSSLLKWVPFTAQARLRAHYRLAEVFSSTYPQFYLETQRELLRDCRLLQKTLMDIDDIKETLPLSALYKYKNILHFLTTYPAVSEKLRDIENALTYFEESLNAEPKSMVRRIAHSEVISNISDEKKEDKKRREEKKKIEWLDKCYQTLQSTLFLIDSQDTFDEQLRVKFDWPEIGQMLSRMDGLVANLVEKEREKNLDFCDASARWRKILTGLVELSVEGQYYTTIQSIFKAYEQIGQADKEWWLYSGLGALFIGKEEDDRLEDYDRPPETLLNRFSSFSSSWWNSSDSEQKTQGLLHKS